MVMPVPLPKRLCGVEERAFNCEPGGVGSNFVPLIQIFSQVSIMVKGLTRSVFPKLVFHKTERWMLGVNVTHPPPPPRSNKAGNHCVLILLSFDPEFTPYI